MIAATTTRWGLIPVYPLLAIECVLLVGTILWWVLIKPYNESRPGANTGAGLAAVLMLPLTLWCLCEVTTQGPDVNSPLGMLWVSLRMVEIIYAVLLVAWMGLLSLYFVTLGLAIKTCSQIIEEDKRQRAIRASQIAALTLALPAILFAFLTLTLWSAFSKVSAAMLFQDQIYQPLLFFRKSASAFLVKDFVERLPLVSGLGMALPITLVTLLAILLALWALIPSVLTEIFPPKAKEQNDSSAKGLGNWLTNGFQFVYVVAGCIVGVVIPILFLCSSKCVLMLLCSGADIPIADAPPILDWIVGLLTASVTGLIAFGDRLNKLALGFRGVLDAVLDVDNYLRMHPRKDNPSARIYARYASLLRHLAQSDPAYDALIIVAHSQGTVITADLLRFLEHEPNSFPEKGTLPPIDFFTMGSPLRQLYSFAFPYPYHWVPDKPENTNACQIQSSNPDPSELMRVKTWVNTFRSGDYVGRYLWQPSFSFSPFKKETRREFCLGAGAHTHYWDSTAPKVAQEIDRLIESAVNKDQQVGT